MVRSKRWFWCESWTQNHFYNHLNDVIKRLSAFTWARTIRTMTGCMLHEIVFFSRKHKQYSMKGVLDRRFESAFQNADSEPPSKIYPLPKISMNAAQKCAFTIVVRAKRWFWWKHEAKSHITTLKWRHINALPVHLSRTIASNNAQCMLTKSSSSRGKHEQYSREGRFVGVLNQRFKTLILPSQNKHERSLSRICWDWRNSFDLEKIQLMRG